MVSWPTLIGFGNCNVGDVDCIYDVKRSYDMGYSVRLNFIFSIYDPRDLYMTIDTYELWV